MSYFPHLKEMVENKGKGEINGDVTKPVPLSTIHSVCQRFSASASPYSKLGLFRKRLHLALYK